MLPQSSRPLQTSQMPIRRERLELVSLYKMSVGENCGRSETTTLKGNLALYLSKIPEGGQQRVPPELSMPPAHPACPFQSSTTTTSSTSTSSAKSTPTQLIDNVEGAESKLLLGTKSSSSPEPSSSTTTSPSSPSETPGKNEANDNLSKYIEEVRMETDLVLDLGAKKVKGDPKQAR
ncbi:hypothetical protein PLEOSDRAFT_1104249 [Pleurotus ostreatus PC15]|uniref:Uncharacterized protein n=1 Tax=Pleurotus ostreatus (strain PC15) TaxID=1137138 RepID=A0A067NTW9_PLEO1|nr:hypothetical protein PLEOSDRAFT_1104249 [Pleurotus ostreatus PC15]